MEMYVHADDLDLNKQCKRHLAFNQILTHVVT